MCVCWSLKRKVAEVDCCMEICVQSFTCLVEERRCAFQPAVRKAFFRGVSVFLRLKVPVFSVNV